MPCANHPEVLEGLNSCSRCGKKFCGDCLVEIKGGSFCAACKSEEVKDIQSGVESGKLPLASIGARFGAQFIDGIVMRIVTIPVQLAFQAGMRPTRESEIVTATLFLVLVQLGAWYLYEALMLHWRGQTLGKMACKIKVVTPEGNDLQQGQAWIRPLVRVLMMVTVIVDYIPALFTKNKTCIHDMAARTRVVKLQG